MQIFIPNSFKTSIFFFKIIYLILQMQQVSGPETIKNCPPARHSTRSDVHMEERSVTAAPTGVQVYTEPVPQTKARRDSQTDHLKSK